MTAWIAVMGVGAADKKHLIETIIAAHPCSTDQTYQEFAKTLEQSGPPNLRSSNFIPVGKAATHSSHHFVFASLPGFQVLSRDLRVVQEITEWLSWTDQHEMKLAGIIYVHSINDNGLSYDAQRFCSVFQRIVGEAVLSSVILATSWVTVDEATGTRRHGDLKETSWAGMIAKGARTARYKGDPASSTNILRALANDWHTEKATKAHKVIRFAIQQEMVDHQRQLKDTDVARFFNRDVQNMTEKQYQRLLGSLLVEYWLATERLDKPLAAKLRARLARVRDILSRTKEKLDPWSSEPTPNKAVVTSVKVNSHGPVYTELQQGQIRTLNLQAGKDPTWVEVSLEVRNLEDQPEYEALSYVVGKPDLTGLLKVRSNGQVEDHYVSMALREVLTALRYSDRDRRLWVDALCIDQKNLKERSEQVRMMSQIFRAAQKVCIWLGPEKDESSVAMKFIPEVVKLEFLDSYVEAKDGKNELGKTVEWAALANLLGRDWFTRRWVVQEMALAKRAMVYCGNDAVPWSDLAIAAELFGSKWLDILRILDKNNPDKLGDAPPPGAASLVDISSNIFRKDGNGAIQERLLSVESLLARLPMFDVTDVRDSFYAIMDLANDTSYQNEVPVNYDMQPADLFRAVLTVAVKTSNSLDILCRPWAPLCKVPSWIRTISDYAYVRRDDGQYDRNNADSLVGLPGQKRYRAAGTSSYHIKFDKLLLLVDGVQIGSIRAIGGRCMNGNLPGDWRRLGGWPDKAVDCPQSFWRTLVADRGPDGSNPPSWYGKAFEYSFRKSPTTDVDMNKMINRCRDSSSVQEFLRRVRAITWKRRLFKMKTIEEGASHECTGLGPASTHGGDAVCVLYGCSVPVVLGVVEKDENGNPKSYELKGECFVYGMMEGQAIRGLRAGKYKATTFVIK